MKDFLLCKFSSGASGTDCKYWLIEYLRSCDKYEIVSAIFNLSE